MIDPNVSAEASEGVSIANGGMRLWNVVAVVGSCDDRWLVGGLCNGVSRCDCICC